MTEWLNAGVCLAQKWQIGCLCQKVIRWLDWMCDLTIDVSDSCRCILLPLLVYLFVLSSIHFFTHSLSQSVGQPVSRSLTHSLTQSVSRSVSHSVDVHVATKAILQFDRTRHLGSFAPAFRGEVMVAKGKLHATRILRTWKWLRSQLEAGKQRNLVHRLSLSILKYLKEWFFDFSVGVSRPLQLNLANLFQSWLFFPSLLSPTHNEFNGNARHSYLSEWRRRVDKRQLPLFGQHNMEDFYVVYTCSHPVKRMIAVLASTILTSSNRGRSTWNMHVCFTRWS